MPDISYVPADSGWTVFRGDETLLAVNAPLDADPAALWALVSAGASAGAILDELISGGISSAPEFVLVAAAAPESTTVLVRGTAVLSARGAGGDHELSGQGVSSWVEQVIDTSGGFELQLGTAASAGVSLVLRSGVVRASAVRTSGLAQAPAPAEAPAPQRAAKAVQAREPIAALHPVVVPPAAVPPPPAVTPPPPPPPAPEPEPDDDDLEATLASESTTVGPPPPVESGGYDHLFGETVFRKVEDAAVREDSVGEPPAAETALDGAHDGRTVMVSDLAAIRARRKAAKAAAAAPAPVGTSFYVELSTGGTERLDQPIVFGRAPSATRVPGGSVPRLVSMNTPNQDISRTHAQVSVEGGTVVVTDLHSSNGTIITLPGKAPQKLRAGEPSAVIVGAVIDLGDGATLTVREQ